MPHRGIPSGEGFGDPLAAEWVSSAAADSWGIPMTSGVAAQRPRVCQTTNLALIGRIGRIGVVTDDAVPIDFEKMMRDLEESGRRRRLIEAERPSADEIGEVLATSIKLARNTLDASRDAVFLSSGDDPNEDYGLRCVAGSLAEQDSLWLAANLAFDVPSDELGEPMYYLAHPLVDPVRCTLDFVQRFVRAAFDHLEALGHLVMDDVGFRATAVLSRAALEACATACYLIDSGVSPAERIRRLWNLQCEQLTEEALRDDDGGEEPRGHRDAVLSAAESAGFSVQRVKPSERYRSPKVLSQDGKPHSSTLEMIEAALTADVGKSMWQGLSDVAHSRSSGLMLLDEFSPREKQIRAMRTESIAFHAMPALLAFTGLGDHLETYLGWEDLSWTDSFEPVVHIWSASSGAADDLIRRKLGIPPV